MIPQDKKKNIKKSEQGLSLLELVISIALFAILILAVAKVFTKSLEIQQRTIDDQNLQGDMRNMTAIFADEIQRATKHTGVDCSCSAGKFFCTNVNKDELYVKSGYADKCVIYSEVANQIHVSKGGEDNPLTSTNIIIEDLNFNVNTRGDSVTATITAKGYDEYSQYITYQNTFTNTFE